MICLFEFIDPMSSHIKTLTLEYKHDRLSM